MNSPVRLARRLGAVCAAGLLVIVLLGGCGESAAPESTSGDADVRDFWSTLIVEADEVESFNSLTELKSSSDLVVIGELDGLTLGRTIQGDAPEDVVLYADARFSVDETIKGSSTKEVNVEFLVPAASAAQARELLKTTADSGLPSSPSLLFLRDKGGAEAGFLRIVNSEGLWVQDNDSVTPPLVPSDRLDGSGVLKEAAEFSTIRDMVERVKAL